MSILWIGFCSHFSLSSSTHGSTSIPYDDVDSSSGPLNQLYTDERLHFRIDELETRDQDIQIEIVRLRQEIEEIDHKMGHETEDKDH